MRVLVTGAAGFIGSNLALELQKGNDVLALDDFRTGDFRNLAGFEGEVVGADLRDFEPPSGLDAIFHQGAITDTTVTDQKLMMEVNTNATGRLLSHAVANNIPFIYASSAAVYGNAPAPQKEEDAGKPNNIYGFSKWAADCIARKAISEHKDAKIVGLRYFNVFGPREGYKGNMASMVWKLSQQMKAGQRPRIFKMGEQKRDQVYVKDVVRANLLAWKTGKSGIVNVGSGKATTFNEVVANLNRVLGTDLKPEYIDNPYVEFFQEHTEADLTLAKKTINYSPEWDFRKAMDDYAKWL